MKKEYERELTKGDKSRFLVCFANNASLCVVSLRLPFLNFAVGRNVVGGTKPEWSLAVFPLCSPFLSSPSAPSSLSPLTPLPPPFRPIPAALLTQKSRSPVSRIQSCQRFSLSNQD